MARRTVDWDAGLAKDLRNKEFARAFILNAIEEGMDLQEVLRSAIKAYGLKEFSRKIKMPSPNILRATAPKANPTRETLNKILKPFGLQIGIMPVADREAA